jgi:lipopolysaccharide export system protein LptA
MLNGEVTLLTDSLNYNRVTNVGYFFGCGEIRDSLNELVSERGYYYADTKEADFRYEVVVVNEDFIMYSDTLKYNTDDKIAEIVGPTVINYKEETTIYSELGWYDTNTQKSELLKNSTVTQDDGRQLKGDTIFYDKPAGVGRAYSNVELNDTSNNISLYGNYGYYQEFEDIGLVTDSALMVEYSSEDTLYLNADTLYSFAMDSGKVVLAYYNVRLFRTDLQGVCDSMVYVSSDSILTMMKRPILWSDNQQMNGDTIRIYFKYGRMDYMHLIENAFISQNEDDTHFNQMSGKEIMCFMNDSTLYRVDVVGNAESLYFPFDNGEFIGMNNVQSSYMNIYLIDGKIDRLVVYPQPTAKMLPMELVGKDNMYLINFSWMQSIRPKDAADVFNRPQLESAEDPETQRRAIIEQEKIKREEERQRRKAEAMRNPERNDGNDNVSQSR